jgi:hypothetical protein
MDRARITLLVRRAVGILFVLLVLAQLVPVDRSNPPALIEIAAPPEVMALLERSCYDCHSNRTSWPWYAFVAPVSWWVVDHVHEARGDLNLTEWPGMDFEQQQFYLGEMKEKIKSQEMPLPSYLLVHRDARLSAAERSQLVEWIDAEVALLGGF